VTTELGNRVLLITTHGDTVHIHTPESVATDSPLVVDCSKETPIYDLEVGDVFWMPRTPHALWQKIAPREDGDYIRRYDLPGYPTAEQYSRPDQSESAVLVFFRSEFLPTN
jgi:hypothetical protein